MRIKPHGQALRRNAGKWLWKVFRFGIILGIGFVILYPIMVKLSVAFMSRSDMYDKTVKWVPRSFTLSNFTEVLSMIDYPRHLLSTLWVSSMASLAQVASCTLAAYGFARFNFPGKRFLFFAVILSLVIPQQTYMVTTYMQYRYFDFYGLLGLFGMAPISLIGTMPNRPKRP